MRRRLVMSTGLRRCRCCCGMLGVLLLASMSATTFAAAGIQTRMVVPGGTAHTAVIAPGAAVAIELRIDAPAVSTIGASFRLAQTSLPVNGYFSITGRSQAGSPFIDPAGGAADSVVTTSPDNILAPGNGINLGNNVTGLVGIAPGSNILLTTLTLTSSPSTPPGTYRIQPTAAISFVTEVTTSALGNDVAMDDAFFDIVVASGTSTVPDAPTLGVIVAGDTTATVNFTTPANNGGSPITSYHVSCNAGAVSISAPSPPVILTGLTNGTSYNCVVTAINAVGASAPSVSASFTPSASPSLLLVGVQSRKSHGTAGTFNLPIDLTQSITGNITVEPRTHGGSHLLVFQFSAPVFALDGVSISPAGTATAAWSGSDVFVTLVGVPDNTRVTVSLAGVNGVVNPAPASVGFLAGDVTNTRAVTAADISAVKVNLGKFPLDNNTYLFDVNADGAINQADLAAVKARAGVVLPP